MKNWKHILFVSTTNTARGYMAEILMKQELEKRGITDIHVDSKGMVVLFPEPVNPKAAIVMKNNHLPVDEHYQTSGLTKEDIERSDLILTMTQEQKEKVLTEYEYEKEIYTVKELGREQGEILDPYGKDLIDYEYCCRELARLIENIADTICENTI